MTATIPPQPLHDTDGKVFAYVVPADQFENLRIEVENLRRQIRSLVPKATPEEEAEMKRLLETTAPHGLRDLIAELEAEGGTDASR